MSYARRPLSVNLAVLLLIVMGVAGLAYAVATIVVMPGVTDDFQASAGTTGVDVAGFVGLLWIWTVVGAVLALIVLALNVVLALFLRKGINGVRIGVWVICLIGFVAGAVALALTLSTTGSRTPGTVGAVLRDAYPSSWITGNVAVLIAQIVGYPVVGLLLLFGTGGFFHRRPAASPGVFAPGQPVAAWPQPAPQPWQTVSPPPPAAPQNPADDDFWRRPSS